MPTAHEALFTVRTMTRQVRGRRKYHTTYVAAFDHKAATRSIYLTSVNETSLLPTIGRGECL